MEVDEKEYFRKVSIDRAYNNTWICMFCLLYSLSTYIVPLIFGAPFDFGLIFESISFILILVARHYMNEYDAKKSKIIMIIAISILALLMTYDIITIISTAINNENELLATVMLFIKNDYLTIICILTFFIVYFCLRKSEDPERFKENTDIFYEKLSEEEKEKIGKE